MRIKRQNIPMNSRAPFTHQFSGFLRIFTWVGYGTKLEKTSYVFGKWKTVPYKS
jgi:hypothetical protein